MLFRSLGLTKDRSVEGRARSSTNPLFESGNSDEKKASSGMASRCVFTAAGVFTSRHHWIGFRPNPVAGFQGPGFCRRVKYSSGKSLQSADRVAVPGMNR